MAGKERKDPKERFTSCLCNPVIVISPETSPTKACLHILPQLTDPFLPPHSHFPSLRAQNTPFLNPIWDSGDRLALTGGLCHLEDPISTLQPFQLVGLMILSPRSPILSLEASSQNRSCSGPYYIFLLLHPLIPILFSG